MEFQFLDVYGECKEYGICIFPFYGVLKLNQILYSMSVLKPTYNFIIIFENILGAFENILGALLQSSWIFHWRQSY